MANTISEKEVQQMQRIAQAKYKLTVFIHEMSDKLDLSTLELIDVLQDTAASQIKFLLKEEQ